MMIPLAASAARRRAAMMAQQQQRRNMGGGHAPAPEWEGIDKVVRGVFPQDYQRKLSVLWGRVGLALLRINTNLESRFSH